MGLEKPAYRADIDGLRAVAVIAVLLFHAGIPGFSGGYVGVDVFFVISGFLITSIVWREVETGAFSIARFYERRARRIMPALLLTLGATLSAGLFVLGVNELTSLTASVFATLFFVSNIYFWRHNGYFEAAAESQPLLHTWSLAIEEQFYVFWPILLILMFRYARGALGPLLWIISLVSLGASAVMVFLSPAATFYLLPTRGWELALGALVALGLFPSLERWFGKATQWIGILLILVPIFAYDKTTLFPGLTALAPCLGTAILIGVGQSRPGLVTRTLSIKPLVAVGLVSYSLYLFHFPILVYLRNWNMGDLPLTSGAFGLLFSLLLAALSYHFVEQPFRNGTRIVRWQLWLSVLTANIALGAAALFIWMSSGLPNRFSSSKLVFLQGEDDIDMPARACLNAPLERINANDACNFALKGSADHAFVWGDSHAAALRPALDPAFTRKGYAGTLVAFNACPPLLGLEPTTLSWADRRRCRERNRDFLEMMRNQRKPSLVIIHAYWSTYARMLDGNDLTTVQASIARNLDVLAGHKVIIVLDTPRANYSVPSALAYGRGTLTIDSSTDDNVSQMLRRAAAGRAKVIDPSTAICPGDPCSSLFNGRPILSDDNHIASSVAKLRLTPLFVSDLPDAKDLSSEIGRLLDGEGSLQ